MLNRQRRTLADWTPEDGPLDEWLARWAAEGWRPEYECGGTETVINGRQVLRFAVIARPLPAVA